ncbi:hypothetical protein MRX96_014042 [Rhipicephalus microplus]
MSAAQVLTRYLKRNSRRLSRQSSRESTSLLSEYDDQIRHFVKIVADFTQQLSKLHSRHAEELQLLVEAFRKRNSELRKERPPYHSSLFNCWEVLLQEVEVDSQVHGDISRCLSQHMGVMLLEKTFHRKAQSRKVFLHRESFENILVKAEELLNKFEIRRNVMPLPVPSHSTACPNQCQGEYAEAYRAVCRRGCTDLTAAPLDQPSPLSASEEQAALAAYYDCHNAYVQQLAATNGMLDEYYGSTLPRLLDELQDVYCDISTIIAQSMLAASDVLANKAREQADHYEAGGIVVPRRESRSDLAGFVRTLCSTDPRNPTGSGVIPATPPRHPFVPPRADDESVSSGDSQLQQPTLGEQVIVDRLASLSVSSRSESLAAGRGPARGAGSTAAGHSRRSAQDAAKGCAERKPLPDGEVHPPTHSAIRTLSVYSLTPAVSAFLRHPVIDAILSGAMARHSCGVATLGGSDGCPELGNPDSGRFRRPTGIASSCDI